MLDDVGPLDEVKVRCTKDETTFKDYAPLDFLAQVTALIPKKWEQTVRYLGHYSARSRGKRRKLAEERGELEPTEVISEDESTKKTKKKSWARLIRKIFNVDPLVCPKCGEGMSIIAVIVDHIQARKISSHLGYRYRAPPPLKPRFSKNFHYDKAA